MKFPTMYSEKRKYTSNRGERYKVEYQIRFDEEGRSSFVETGKTDMHEFIQSFRDSVDIYNILERFRAGNVDILNQIQGVYADVNDLPVKLQDVLNLNLKGKEIFDKLPVDVKEIYENNYVQFLMNPGKAFSDERLNNTGTAVGDDTPSGDSGATGDDVKE